MLANCSHERPAASARAARLGSTLSPLLNNVYLHHALDLRGPCCPARSRDSAKALRQLKMGCVSPLFGPRHRTDGARHEGAHPNSVRQNPDDGRRGNQ